MFENQEIAKGEVVLYQPNETTVIEVILEQDNIWLTQPQIAELFQKERSGITKHISNIFNEGELEEKSNVNFFHIANFSDGQIFDAYAFACELIRSAQRRLVLIDNYVDETVLEMFAKRQQGVEAIIYTAKITSSLRLDLERHNEQYPPITLQTCCNFHDRFLLVDDRVYHIGASLKDLGKKLFAFSLLADFGVEEIIGRVVG